MTSRARIFDLFAMREATRIAGLGHELQQVSVRLEEAVQSGARLSRMAQDIRPASGPGLAADLRAGGMLTTRLLDEADRLAETSARAAEEALRLRQALGQHDQRRRFGTSSAVSARVAEAEEAEARADTTRPQPRRD